MGISRGHVSLQDGHCCGKLPRPNGELIALIVENFHIMIKRCDQELPTSATDFKAPGPGTCRLIVLMSPATNSRFGWFYHRANCQ